MKLVTTTSILFIHTCSLMAIAQFCGDTSTFLQDSPSFEIAMNTPYSFGKTHFIVGMPTHSLEPVVHKEHRSIHKETSASNAFFSPDDNIRTELIRYIEQEAEKIQIAIFMITDHQIAKALADAVQRNVAVELITDVGCLKERSNKINELCNQGCFVRIYDPSYDQHGRTSLMHHKFALFTNNHGKSVVWTGSYNFTKAASSTNQENVLVVDDPKLFTAFQQQFKRLKKRSHQYGIKKKGART